VRARILQIRIVQVGTIDRAVVVDRGRNVEVVVLLAVGITHELADAAIVHALRPVLRIPDQFVDEIAQMQHEPEAILGRGLLVLEDHASIRILRTVVDVLARHEREAHRPPIVFGRRRQRAADAAAVAIGIGEAIPVFVRRLEAADQHAAGPIGSRRYFHVRCRDDVLECLVRCDFAGQVHAGLRTGARPTSP
jgi:hypothetical protein